MKGDEKTIQFGPNNFFCIYCADLGYGFVRAEHLMWDDMEECATPVCGQCKEIMENEKHFFSIFSIN